MYLIAIIAKNTRININPVRELFKNKTFIKDIRETRYSEMLLFFLAIMKERKDKKEKIIPCIK
jgi:hypothetical protein